MSVDQALAALIRRLESDKVTLDDVNFPDIRLNGFDSENLKGIVAEAYAKKRLSQCEGVSLHIVDPSSPMRVNGYVVKPRFKNMNDSNFIVYEGKREKTEFDIAGEFSGHPFIVETKSIKIPNEKKLRKRIQTLSDVGGEIWGEDVSVILQFPFFYSEKKVVDKMCNAFPHLHCLDAGYKRPQLNAAVNRIYIDIARETAESLRSPVYQTS